MTDRVSKVSSLSQQHLALIHLVCFITTIDKFGTLLKNIRLDTEESFDLLQYQNNKQWEKVSIKHTVSFVIESSEIVFLEV